MCCHSRDNFISPVKVRREERHSDFAKQVLDRYRVEPEGVVMFAPQA